MHLMRWVGVEWVQRAHFSSDMKHVINTRSIDPCPTFVSSRINSLEFNQNFKYGTSRLVTHVLHTKKEKEKEKATLVYIN